MNAWRLKQAQLKPAGVDAWQTTREEAGLNFSPSYLGLWPESLEVVLDPGPRTVVYHLHTMTRDRGDGAVRLVAYMAPHGPADVPDVIRVWSGYRMPDGSHATPKEPDAEGGPGCPDYQASVGITPA